jgi:hypothetical protein
MSKCGYHRDVVDQSIDVDVVKDLIDQMQGPPAMSNVQGQVLSVDVIEVVIGQVQRLVATNV